MRINSLKAVFLYIIFLVSQVLSQTPSGSSPSTTGNIAVSYGSTQVTPGIMLPRSVTSAVPTFSFTPSSPNQTYTLLLVDLSINAATLNTSTFNPTYQLPLAAGIAPNRTTRLHYWQAGLQFSSNGTLINTTEPVAFYQGPAPPAGDVAHTYVFYLFGQEAGFTAPAADSPFNVANVNRGMNRMSFNVQDFARETGVGPLAAANYILVQNTTGSQTGTASGSASATGSAMAPKGAAFLGEAGRTCLGGVGGLFMAVGAGVALLIT
ncbi:MAG: hypothetical protein Q9217_006419 [Psora testacea]